MPHFDILGFLPADREQLIIGTRGGYSIPARAPWLAEALTNPVLLLVEPARSPVIDVSTANLRARLQDLGRTADHLELDVGFAAARPQSRAVVYWKIEEFFKTQRCSSLRRNSGGRRPRPAFLLRVAQRDPQA